ncbi:uracil-xanthine permease family protein [Defluviitalea phaphyphila]|uniref:uracil-xanthine permease family protein n=1 Tax=Defluviitalea phaphyphila TaxID=1473580 RepID=UPI0007300B0C|nr:uracil-xanthine permease family protein [Defluviitalea phaphyphila]
MNITKRKIILGVQHVLAMFGATVLVPSLTGLDPSIAILCAGLGTLIFHASTKGIVPVFLGSSFAFINAIKLVLEDNGIGAVKGGIIAAGLVYVIMAGVIKLFGVEKVRSFFPPIVTGPIIMVIGLRLSPTAIHNSMYETIIVDGMEKSVFNPMFLMVSLIVVATMIIVSIFAKGFFKLVPILISVIVGYIVSIPLDLVEMEKIKNAAWIGFETDTLNQILTLPNFSLSGILAIAPIALVVFIEHIGDITTNGAVVGKDFFKNPGIHRTMLGDGLATMVAGLLGGPANTTYSENTGVLAVTKVYDPAILRIAAVFAIIISFVGKIGAIIRYIPSPVMGGISIILFGMIASVGVRILIESKLDFAHSRNLIISALILVCGIGIQEVPIYNNITISGLAIAALIGVILNKILPNNI